MLKITKKNRKINTLENKVEELESIIKDELYKIFMEKLSEPAKMERLIQENKRLRKKNKLLKEIIKGDENNDI